MGRKKYKPWASAAVNLWTYNFYYEWLKNIAINSIKWENLPDTCDARFLELMLFDKGMCLFFKDTYLEKFLTLPAAISGKWNIYNIPIRRDAYASNGYKYTAYEGDSTIIWNSYLHTPMVSQCRLFAQKLYEIERAIDTNVKGQKYPILIKGPETQRLVLKNLYEQYDGNEPFIFGDSSLPIDDISVLNTGSPYVADKLFDLRNQYFNAWLTYCGVENSNGDKKERLITDEVGINYGVIEANRLMRLDSRKQACEEINRMYNLNIDVQYNSSLPTMVNGSMNPNLKIDKERIMGQNPGPSLEENP